MPPCATADSVFFRSNRIGMPLEEISPTLRDDYSYVLERKREGPIIEEILTRDGEVFRTSMYERKGKLTYGRHYEGPAGGKLLRETVESGGRLLEEKINDNSGGEVRRYGWKESVLEYTEIYFSDGTITRNRFIRGEEGQLLQVVRELLPPADSSEGREKGEELPLAEETVAEFHSSPEGGTNQWHIDPAGDTHFFSQDRKSKIHEKYCNGVLSYTYKEEVHSGGIKTIEIFHEEEREIVKDLDENRKILSMTESGKGGVTHASYSYEGGLLRELRVEKNDTVEKTLYEYADTDNPDALPQREILYRNGKVVKEIFYIEGSTGGGTTEGRTADRRELLYREGVPIVELLYDGDEVIESNSLLTE